MYRFPSSLGGHVDVQEIGRTAHCAGRASQEDCLPAEPWRCGSGLLPWEARLGVDGLGRLSAQRASFFAFFGSSRLYFFNYDAGRGLPCRGPAGRFRLGLDLRRVAPLLRGLLTRGSRGVRLSPVGCRGSRCRRFCSDRCRYRACDQKRYEADPEVSGNALAGSTGRIVRLSSPARRRGASRSSRTPADAARTHWLHTAGARAERVAAAAKALGPETLARAIRHRRWRAVHTRRSRPGVSDRREPGSAEKEGEPERVHRWSVPATRRATKASGASFSKLLTCRCGADRRPVAEVTRAPDFEAADPAVLDEEDPADRPFEVVR
jgi:hypothetical protein